MKHPTVADASFTTSVAVELFAVRDYNTADVVPTAAPPPPQILFLATFRRVVGLI